MIIADPLSDGTIAIRPFRMADAEPVFAAIQESLEAVAPWLPDLGAARSPAEIAAWIESTDAGWDSGSAYNFAIVAAPNGRLLGGCGLTQIGPRHRHGNLYYWVRSSARGQGIAPAATRLLACFGLEVAGLQRVEIIMAMGNTASRRVAEKAGATREGLLRNRLRLHGLAHDAILFSLIPGDLGLPEPPHAGA